MAERVRVRDLTNEQGNRLLRIVRRSSGLVVTWRRVQMVLLSRGSSGVESEGNDGEEAACSAALPVPAARRFPEPCPASMY